MGEFLKCLVFDLKGSLDLTLLRFDYTSLISGNEWCNLCSGCCISSKNDSH